ncbi:MAG TPA: IS4 family transposase [Isosphaeraceae bacterium]|nr:IS4 family transposase [Isosphaeraceae bacterium]
MDPGKLVFAQLMDFVPRHDFDACVRRYSGDSRPRGFSCRDQFLCLAFAQLTFRESLRDIETCLRALESKLYHAGFRGKVSRSTLADANRAHDWHIFADFAQVLIGRARKLYADEPIGVELEETVYALDSTTIDLCLSLFPWARFRRRKGAVKLHTLLDLRGNIPTFVRITHGKTHDVTVLDHLPIEPGAFYVMDRGYVDFRRLHRFTTCPAFFVTRAKRGLDFTRRARRRVDKTTGLRSDQTIVLVGLKTSRLYPDPLRRVVFYDAENDRRFVFLTNNFTLPALTIAKLYKCRWQVELFFKWIKQNLHIKSFYGTSDNAVRVQVWIAISVYVLVAIVRRELGVERSMSEILQILSLTLFEKTPIFQALSGSNSRDPEPPFSNQLSLFDL